jgi:hypothetical protein
MAFTITSYNTKVESAGSIYSYPINSATQYQGVNVLVNYTKGDETSADLTFDLTFDNDKQLYSAGSAVKFAVTEINQGTLTGNVLKFTRHLTATGIYCIIVPCSTAAKKLFINVANTGGTPTGTLVIGAMTNFAQ